MSRLGGDFAGAARPRATPAESGYSLVELLVSTLLTTLILGGMYTALFQSQVTVEAQLSAMSARQQARVAVDRVVPEARMAGFRIDNLPEPIEAAAAEWFSFVGDIDNGSPEEPCGAAIENAVNGGAERVTYGVSGNSLVREVECWNGSAWSDGSKETVARDLVSGGTVFRYFDGMGTELTPGAGGLTAAQRARVRSVTFTVAVSEPHPDQQIVIQPVDADEADDDHYIFRYAPRDVHIITNSASLRNVR